MAQIDGQQINLNDNGDLKALAIYANKMRGRYDAIRDGATFARQANAKAAEINASTVYNEEEKTTLLAALQVDVKYAKQRVPPAVTIAEAREVVAGTRDFETWEAIEPEDAPE